jgi:hypothetical protein
MNEEGAIYNKSMKHTGSSNELAILQFTLPSPMSTNKVWETLNKNFISFDISRGTNEPIANDMAWIFSSIGTARTRTKINVICRSKSICDLVGLTINIK